MPIERICLYSDGGSRPNPGAGAIAVVVCDADGRPLYEFSEAIGHATNNQAEYRAHITGLEICRRYRPTTVTARADSELLIRQLSGRYKVKDPQLRQLLQVAKEKAGELGEVHYQHVPRTNRWIARADQLANEARDGHAVDREIVKP
jgi:ribonuclease HI